MEPDPRENFRTLSQRLLGEQLRQEKEERMKNEAKIVAKLF